MNLRARSLKRLIAETQAKLDRLEEQKRTTPRLAQIERLINRTAALLESLRVQLAGEETCF